MTRRHVRGVITTASLTCGLVIFVSAGAGAQQSPELPKKGGPITVWGCFVEHKIHDNGKFQLLNPTVGKATSVPDGTCEWSENEPVIKLEDVHDKNHHHRLDKSLAGRFMEVTGRLEDQNKTGLREVHVRSFRVVPVVPPKATAAAPAPSVPQLPGSESTVEPTPALPAADTFEAAELPTTASSLPLVALFGAFALAAGLAFYALRRRIAG